jgi:prepilin-type processing-associated H-X9-DG protein
MILKRPAATLVELLVVIAIVGLLLGILMAAIQRVREAANRVSCESNMRQVAMALHQFHDDRNRPVGFSWMVPLLPYVEENSAWQQAQEAKRIQPDTNINPPHVGASMVIKLYTCPTDGRLRSSHMDPDGFLIAFSSYVGVWGGVSGGPSDGVFAHSPLDFSAVRDGLSNTIMLAERPPPDTLLAGRWYSAIYDNRWAYMAQRGPDHLMYAYYPSPVIMGGTNPDSCRGPFRFGPGRTVNPCERFHFWSLHPGGANFAFADGSVRFLSYSAEPLMIPLATANGGEVVELLD